MKVGSVSPQPPAITCLVQRANFSPPFFSSVFWHILEKPALLSGFIENFYSYFSFLCSPSFFSFSLPLLSFFPQCWCAWMCMNVCKWEGTTGMADNEVIAVCPLPSPLSSLLQTFSKKALTCDNVHLFSHPACSVKPLGGCLIFLFWCTDFLVFCLLLLQKAALEQLMVSLSRGEQGWSVPWHWYNLLLRADPLSPCVY